ncbi:MAG: hypothetical protein Q9192_004716 [Flavoplaca navasiana]
MSSQSPDKKRLVSRPFSPIHKRRKSSAKDQDVQDEHSGPQSASFPGTRGRSTLNQPKVSASPTDTNVLDKGMYSLGRSNPLLIACQDGLMMCLLTPGSYTALSRSHSSSHYSESVREAKLAARKAIREGKRPERYDPYASDHKSGSIWWTEEYCQADEEGLSRDETAKGDFPKDSPREESSGDESLGRPGPSTVNSKRRPVRQETVSSDDPCWSSSSGNSSLGRFLAQIDQVHNVLDHIDDEHHSLDRETWSSSERANSLDEVNCPGIEPHSAELERTPPDDIGAGSAGRKFSYQAEHEFSFIKSSCPSPSPSLARANETPGAHLDPDGNTDSVLNVSKVRGRLPEGVEPTGASAIELREVSPWSKERPDWRYSKRVVAGVITGSMRLQHARASSQDSNAEGNRSSASMKVRSSSISSIATNLTVDWTNEMGKQLGEALDTEISTCCDAMTTNTNRLSRNHLEGPPATSGLAVTARDILVGNVDDGQGGTSSSLRVAHGASAGAHDNSIADASSDGTEGFSRSFELTPDKTHYTTFVRDDHDNYYAREHAQDSEQPLDQSVRDDNNDEAFLETPSTEIDPSLQAGVYCKKWTFPTDHNSGRPNSTAEARHNAPLLDPSLQAGAYGRKLSINSDTPEPIFNPTKGRSHSSSLPTSDAGIWMARELVVGKSKPVHSTAAGKQEEDESDTVTCSGRMNYEPTDPSRGLLTRAEADSIMAAQRAVHRTEPKIMIRPIEWNEPVYDGAGDQRNAKRRALMDRDSPPLSPKQVRMKTASPESSTDCLLGSCFGVRLSCGGAATTSDSFGKE